MGTDRKIFGYNGFGIFLLLVVSPVFSGSQQPSAFSREMDTTRLALMKPDFQSSDPLPRVHIAMLGNWAKPQEADLPLTATLWEAGMAAGGPIQWPPGMMQVMRKDTLLLQINLNHATARTATLGSLGLQPGDVLFNGFPPPPVSGEKMAKVKEGLTVSIQVLAIMSSLLFTYSTYVALHAQGKL